MGSPHEDVEEGGCDVMGNSKGCNTDKEGSIQNWDRPLEGVVGDNRSNIGAPSCMGDHLVDHSRDNH